MESGNQMLDFHMKHIYAIAGDDSELVKAMHLLEIAIYMVKHRQGFNVVNFHLKRVQALGSSNEELGLHLHFLTECVHVIDRNT